MPDRSSSASAIPLPALTRRGLLVGTASLASPITPAAALSRPTQPIDAELTALWRRFEQACAVHDAAQQHFNDCENRYFDQCPDVPRELTHQGALGHLIREWDYWRARDLRGLLRSAEHRGEWEAAKVALSIALAHERREYYLRRKLRLREAERAHAAAIKAIYDLIASILSAPACSRAGFAVKARAVKLWAGPGWWSEEPAHAEISERLAAQVLDWVIAEDSRVIK